MLNQIRDAISNWGFISNWANENNLQIDRKEKVKLILLTNALLPSDISQEVKRRFYEAIAIQRYWDDLYDKNIMSETELLSVRNHVMNNTDTNEPIALSMSKAFNGLLSEFRQIKPLHLVEPIIQDFLSETNLILDGYEFESQLSDSSIDSEVEEKYFYFASKTIALEYVMCVLGINLVKTAQDLENFREMRKYSTLAARTIRMANDLASYEKELEENKINLVGIKVKLYNLDVKTVKTAIRNEIDLNLEKINRIPDTTFTKFLKRISLLTTNRYLKNV